MVIKIENEMYVVTDFLHVTPGNWRGFVQTTLRSLRTGKITKQRFRSTDNLEDVTLEPKNIQFLYKEGDNYHFMDLGDYTTIFLSAETIGTNARYLTEGLELEAEFHEGRVVSLKLPNQVSLKVEETVPGVKGDSATSNTKPATLETGLVLQVPLFIKVGDAVQVDTRTGEYLGRA
jgi:elongation factor P